MERIIDALPFFLNKIIIVVGYKKEQIKKFLGEKYKNREIYYVVQKKLNGTGRALLLTRKYFKEKERFLILNADELLTQKEIKGCFSKEFSWISRHIKNPQQSAVAAVSKNKKIVSVIEKPKNKKFNLVLGGMILASSDIFKYKPVKGRKGEYRVESMMNKFIRSHDVFAFFGENKVENISPGTPEELDKLDKKFSIRTGK